MKKKGVTKNCDAACDSSSHRSIPHAELPVQSLAAPCPKRRLRRSAGRALAAGRTATWSSTAPACSSSTRNCGAASSDCLAPLRRWRRTCWCPWPTCPLTWWPSSFLATMIAAARAAAPAAQAPALPPPRSRRRRWRRTRAMSTTSRRRRRSATAMLTLLRALQAARGRAASRRRAKAPQQRRQPQRWRRQPQRPRRAAALVQRSPPTTSTRRTTSTRLLARRAQGQALPRDGGDRQLHQHHRRGLARCQGARMSMSMSNVQCGTHYID